MQESQTGRFWFCVLCRMIVVQIAAHYGAVRVSAACAVVTVYSLTYLFMCLKVIWDVPVHEILMLRRREMSFPELLRLRTHLVSAARDGSAVSVCIVLQRMAHIVSSYWSLWSCVRACVPAQAALEAHYKPSEGDFSSATLYDKLAALAAGAAADLPPAPRGSFTLGDAWLSKSHIIIRGTCGRAVV